MDVAEEKLRELCRRLVAMARIEQKWAELGDIPAHRRLYWAGRAEARWESLAWLTEVFGPPYLNRAARARLGWARKNIAEIERFLTEQLEHEKYAELVVKELRRELGLR
jgi:hypothetical protein